MTDIKPLGHELNLDNPDDVDWLLKWAQTAEKKIHELEAELCSSEEYIHHHHPYLYKPSRR